MGDAIVMAVAIAEAIREVKEVPSGTLYAMLVGRVTMEGYTSIIRTLKGAGLVEETSSHLLRWTGPAEMGAPGQRIASAK
mgnify:CR=1 FL=1